MPSLILWDVSERNLYYGEQCYYSCRRTGQENEDQYAKGFVQCYRRAMLEWVLTACENAELDDICVVKGYEGQQIEDYLAQRKSKADICTVMQEERLGTGHAVMQAADFLKAQLRETHLYSAATLLLSTQKLSRVRWSFILKRTAA